MNVTCPNCATVYRVDPAKVPEAGVRARCAVCSAVFAVEREQRGRFAFYMLADERVGALLELADEILTDGAHGVYVCPRYEAPGAVD